MSFDLQGYFEKSWNHAIDMYLAGKVNSERTLQAIMYSHLVSVLPDCTVLCEPRLPIDQHGVFIPDLVVVNRNNKIVAVLEIKFVPHHFPVFEVDIAKLRALALDGERSSFQLVLQPATGKFTDVRMTTSPECLFVFAVVGRSDAKALDSETVVKAFFCGEVVLRPKKFLVLSHSTQ